MSFLRIFWQLSCLFLLEVAGIPVAPHNNKKINEQLCPVQALFYEFQGQEQLKRYKDTYWDEWKQKQNEFNHSLVCNKQIARCCEECIVSDEKIEKSYQYDGLKAAMIDSALRNATACHEAGHLVVSEILCDIKTAYSMFSSAVGNAGETGFDENFFEENSIEYHEKSILLTLAGGATELIVAGKQINSYKDFYQLCGMYQYDIQLVHTSVCFLAEQYFPELTNQHMLLAQKAYDLLEYRFAHVCSAIQTPEIYELIQEISGEILRKGCVLRNDLSHILTPSRIKKAKKALRDRGLHIKCRQGKVFYHNN